MDRAGALSYLKDSGFDPLMTAAGRLTTDLPAGYKPAIDRSLRYLGVATADLSTAVVPPTDEPAYEALLRATTYDLLLPGFVLSVDQSVDAPLTNVKASQAYRQLKEMRDAAWEDVAGYGFGPADVTITTVTLDYLEPVDDLVVSGV